MHPRIVLRCVSMSLCAIAASGAFAATLTVHKTLGPHTTVNSALTAANPGDEIVITDNSSTYTENLYVTKNNITIQSTLNPAPIIMGVQAPHPLAGSLSAPQKWWYTTGDANSASPGGLFE